MRNIRHRKPNRLKGYDYSRDGWYFITICVKNRIECLGKIEKEKMSYSRYGDIALKCWQAIPQHYENVFLDEWIIMPNHIHGIIVIVGTEQCFSVGTEQCFSVGTEQCFSVGTEQCFSVGTEQCSSVGTEQCFSVGTEQCSVPTMNGAMNGKNYGLLSKIVKSFKEISLKMIRKNFNDNKFTWQRSFYDHIIRNEKSLEKIRQYIYYNPVKWELDRNNLENLLM